MPIATRRIITVQAAVTPRGDGTFTIKADVYDFFFPDTETFLHTVEIQVADEQDATIQAAVDALAAEEARDLQLIQAVPSLTDDFRTEVVPTSIIAEWDGNSELGQLVDASPNVNNLTLSGTVANPSSPTPPEGDRYLLELSHAAGSGVGDYLAIPITARPDNAKGSIQGFLSVTETGGDSIGVNFYAFDTDDGGGTQRYAYLFKQIGTSNMVLGYTDATGTPVTKTLADASAYYDGADHRFAISWRTGAGPKVYLDGVLIPDLSDTTDIDFGTALTITRAALASEYTESGAGASHIVRMDGVRTSTDEFVPA